MLPLNNQQTSVWNNETECSVDNPEQKTLKRRELSALLLMMLKNCIHI